MCGIFCKLSKFQNASKTTECDLKNYERTLDLLSYRGPDASHSSCYLLGDTTVFMFGATLWMQGEAPCKQPLETEAGALLFNGDVYNKINNPHQSDTEEILLKMMENKCSDDDIKTIRNIVGPFSLIYLNKRSDKLYFCRDRYGRKSLLFHKSDCGYVISSVLGKAHKDVIEIPAKSIYCIDLSDYTLTEFPWSETNTRHIINPDVLFISLENQDNFSIDSDETVVTESPEISLLYNELKGLSLEINCKKLFLKKVLSIGFFCERADKLLKLLSESVKTRILTQPPYCKKCINDKIQCPSHCRVGVLFSGGLDCTILAALAHNHVPLNESIDLLNVAFENKNCENYQVPDRMTSLESLNELQLLYPERKWNLLQINVTADELQKKQVQIISDLVYPLRTILDESLGSALWFAARGKLDDYVSTSRVILMGMGADELFGGYTRHRNAFRRGGWGGLNKELQLDWKRLPSRNLARDDRIISHHGRQPRTPYLDESFLDYILQLKPWERCFPSDCCGGGVGDKLLLRLAAMKIGLENTSVFPKRAIQFGSRIANKNENGKDISPRLIFQ